MKKKEAINFLLEEFGAEDREDLSAMIKQNVDIDFICEAMRKFSAHIVNRFIEMNKQGIKNIRIENNEVFFTESGEKRKIGLNKQNVPYLGFIFQGKWHYQYLGNRYDNLLNLIQH